jgi:acyl-CoA reductase-like NAD-dependent aldehyde dehydrogenase
METALGVTPRLEGELARTTGHWRAFARMVRSGWHLEPMIDTADASRPDIRRMLQPLGPVAVFGASNFPLAFSVPGGDTASALAAGCPVVSKGHPSHPATSELSARAIAEALSSNGAPSGAFSMIQGKSLEVGRQLVASEQIAAVAFTGSFSAGRAIHDQASTRPTPIPVYAETGSLNPVFVSRGALRERESEIVAWPFSPDRSASLRWRAGSDWHQLGSFRIQRTSRFTPASLIRL